MRLVCSFALSKHSAQTPNPVLELEYLRPVNSNGRKLERSVILHFLSMGEFVDAVLQDDFELGVSGCSTSAKHDVVVVVVVPPMWHVSSVVVVAASPVVGLFAQVPVRSLKNSLSFVVKVAADLPCLLHPLVRRYTIMTTRKSPR